VSCRLPLAVSAVSSFRCPILDNLRVQKPRGEGPRYAGENTGDKGNLCGESTDHSIGGKGKLWFTANSASSNRVETPNLSKILLR
jgi:hypothetical protein